MQSTKLTCIDSYEGITFLIISYVAGFSLDIIAEALINIANFFISYITKKLDGRLIRFKNVWTLNVWKVIDEYAYSEQNTQGSNLRKWMAEAALFRTLFVSWIVLWILNIEIVSVIGFKWKLAILFILFFNSFCRDIVTRKVANQILVNDNKSKEDYMF